MEINLYVPINWQNFKSGNTALEAINLDHEEEYLTYIGQFLKELPTIATKVSELDNDLNFVINTDMENYVQAQIESIGNIQTIKGRVDTESELPTENNKVGDVWIVGTIDSDYKSEYVWTSFNTWEELGNVSKVDLSNYYDKAEIDTFLDDCLKASNIVSVQYNEELQEFQYSLDGETWITIYSGRTGDNGATFIPSVDDEGNISWSNDKMLPNPPTKNIKGPKGDKGFSPSIEVQENTATSYILKVNNETESYLTPNLKGKNGEGSGDMEKATYDTNDDGIVNQADKVTHTLSITVDHVNKLYDGSKDVNIDITLPSGDMIKSIYDTNDDGVVDNSEKLGGELPSYYATKAEIDLGLYGTESGSKNLFDGVMASGNLNASGLNIPDTTNRRLRTLNYVNVKPNTTYTISSATNNLQVSHFEYVVNDYTTICHYNNINWPSLPYTFTTQSNTKYIRFSMRFSEGTQISVSDVNGIQIEEGTQATPYIPYIKSNLQLTNDILDVYARNPNLLDNSDFRVNQRGLTTNIQNEYFADRWMCRNEAIINRNTDGTITILQNSATTPWIGQFVEVTNMKQWLNKTYTLSIELEDGAKYSGSVKPTQNAGVYQAFNLNGGTVYLQFGWGEDKFLFCFNTPSYDGDITIKNFKLELGSVATPFVPKPYAEELANCQRYFLGNITQRTIGVMNPSNGGLFFTIATPVTMRAQPTLTIKVKGQFVYSTNQGTTQAIVSTLNGTGMTLGLYSNCVDCMLDTTNSETAARIGIYEDARLELSAEL